MVKSTLRHLSLLALVIAFSSSLVGQESIFAFGFNPDGKKVDIDEAESSNVIEYHSSKAVLDQLVSAKGDRAKLHPKIKIVYSEQKPAWIDVNKATIYLEKKAFDVCRSFGADSLNALALLLSHELTHYYENHDWHDNFMHFYNEEDFHSEEDVNTGASRARMMELQADQLGGFLANMAGYNSSNISSQLVTKIYESYGLDQSHKNIHYPSLAERVAIAEESEKQLDKMNQAFIMSKYLTIVGEYNLANEYLDYVMVRSKFQSRELYNNKGLLMCLSASQSFSKEEMPFYLPFVVDEESRLTRRSNETIRSSYLKEAESAFRNAIQLDENYLGSYLNLSSVYLLQNNFFDAEYYCQKIFRGADKVQHKRIVAGAYVNLGIIEYLKGNSKEAKQHFDQSKQLFENGLGQKNLNILEGKEDKIISTKNVVEVSMEDVNLKVLLSSILQGEEESTCDIEVSKENMYYKINKEKSQVHINLEDWGDEGHHFFQEGLTVKVNGRYLNKGDSKQELQSILGETDLRISGLKKDYYCYKDYSLIVELNDSDLVESLVLYYIGK